MKRAFAIGETFYDITFREKRPISANPGGAMLNTAVSLARCGIDVTLITEFSTDHLGDMVNEFLKFNGVNTENIYRYEGGETPLALAFLDEMNDAKYVFYETYPPERLQIATPAFRKEDIVLFGSLMAVSEQAREKLLDIIKAAKDAGAILIYDPNLRESLLNRIKGVRSMVKENISLAHVVQGSHRDFEIAFGKEDAEQVYEHVKECGCNCLIYTKNDRGVWLKTDKCQKYHPVPSVEVVSTIGAGDSFNAGLIYRMHSLEDENFFPEWNNQSSWEYVITTAISFATHVCTHTENYISKDFASLLK
ncbi:carbohydrate kinase [uncultured Methanomethylovorans sp.]|uniref:carbohydrate kinase family protein n=1 Tax=uncultured Methanomethylovorans sp. TaxID=183759 RepID=UPI002AA8CB46|nr:carbohydrate kinase [uncultured Methanomethylovorans sp.]